jgi:heat shock protein HslJ
MKVILLRVFVLALLPALFCFPQALAQVPESLTNSSWGLISIKDKRGQTLRPTGRKDRYRISFDPEGRVEAQVDCNLGRGTFKSESPGQITFGPMALTKTMCPRGPLYDRIVNEVQHFRTYRLEGGHLFLSTADDITYEFEALPYATLESDPPSSIYGLVWRLLSINDVDVSAPQAHLEFDDKSGRFSGHGGCNRISGDLKGEGSKIKFERAMSTKRACVDTRLQQIENSFFNGLAEINEYEININGPLYLKKDGRTIFVLTSDQVRAEGHVTGTIRYLQRMALPSTAVIEVKLLEAAPAGSGKRAVLPDDNPRGIAENVIKADDRQVPIKFDLTYDPYGIDPKTRYVIRARIINGNRLLFNTTDWYPVITFGNPDSVDVIVKPLRR